MSLRFFFSTFIAALLGSCAPAYAKTVSITFSQLPPREIRQELSSFKDGNAAREAQLRKMFLKAGCAAADVKDEFIRRRDPPNLICTLPGSSDSEIIVGAHTDHVDVGEGVVDDWSGAAGAS